MSTQTVNASVLCPRYSASGRKLGERQIPRIDLPSRNPRDARRKLLNAGFDPDLARVPKPETPILPLDFSMVEKIEDQIAWTRMLIRLVSR
jgi:hypothetical protein